MLHSQILARGPGAAALTAQRPLAAPCCCSPTLPRRTFKARVRCSVAPGDEPPAQRGSGFKNPFGNKKQVPHATSSAIGCGHTWQTTAGLTVAAAWLRDAGWRVFYSDIAFAAFPLSLKGYRNPGRMKRGGCSRTCSRAKKTP